MTQSLLMQHIIDLLQGVGVTASLVFIALIIAFILALGMACLKLLNTSWINGVIGVFSFVIRGTPLLVQFFIIYYGTAQFTWLHSQGWLWPLFKSAYSCAIIALAINSAAYTYELIWGGMRNLPQGEWDAARAFGMSLPVLLPNIIFQNPARHDATIAVK